MNILNKLTIKHLTMNKKRTIVSIVGIILSTALMVGIGLLMSTFRELLIKDVQTYNGSYNASIIDVSKSKLDIISNNSNVSDVYYKQYMGYAYIKSSSYSNADMPYYKLYGASSEYLNKLKLTSGRLPKSSNEIVISSELSENSNANLKIGDSITLNLGDRYSDGKIINDDEYTDGETLTTNDTKTYTIVGVVSHDVLESYSIPGYDVFTKADTSCKNALTVFIEYKNPAKAYKVTPTIASSIGLKSLDSTGETYSEISYNDSLLSMYGASKYNNIISSMYGMLAIMLGLVSIACIIVIYNSFAISVLERKKQFGLFSSIGATRKQIRKTVLFEAIVVSLIGIPLGIAGAYLGIWIVSLIMNNLIGDALGVKIVLSTYPVFIIIPVLFMIVTILISAFIPAKKASKISPIEAIRLNDDIKIKGKKVKAPKFVEKLFGIEGTIAYKNMKRNKKKYRITVVSLFISIVLFVSFSGYLKYTLSGTENYLDVPNFDVEVDYANTVDNKIIDTIKNNQDVKEYVTYKMLSLYSTTDFNKMYSQKYQDFLKNNSIASSNEVIVLVLDNKTYNNYLKTIGKKVAKPILYNNYSGIIYSKKARTSYVISKYSDTRENINISESYYTSDADEQAGNPSYKTLMTFDDYYVTDKDFLSLEALSASTYPIIILNQNQATKLDLTKVNNSLIIKAPSYNNLDKEIKNIIKNNSFNDSSYFNYNNIAEQMKMMKNVILVLKILIYGFITLVTLIGVTSVFNTINTSIALRRKEFAVLRSIGLTPSGFNKILCFESLFFGLKSLLYGLPVSFGVLYLIHLSMHSMVNVEYLLIPWPSIIIATIGVFIVIGLSTIYATKRMKKENILEAIREENI